MRAALVMLVGVALVTGRAEALDEWTWENTSLEAGFAVALAADYSQTRWAMRQHDFHEGNPIIGRHPGEGRLLAYNASALVLHAGVSALLPRDWRRMWQSLTVGVEIAQVTRNWAVGAHFQF